MRTIFYAEMKLNDQTVVLAATEKGLCYVGTFIHDVDDFLNWASKHFSTYSIEKNETFLKVYQDQLVEYIEGSRHSFELPIDIQVGTAFQQNVWRALTTIPYGTTRTYSDIAQSIGKPSSVRAVANAIGKNPLTIVIPCHRVIGKNGKLTGFAGGLDMKKYLLDVEISCKK